MFDIPHLVSLHLVCPFRCRVSRLEDGVFGELFVSFPCCFEIALKCFKMLGNLALRGEYFTMGGEERVFLLSWGKDYFFCFPEQVSVIAFHALTKTFLDLK